MNKSEVLKELQSAGSAQTRKTYTRHGVTGDMYGVSYSTLGKLVKKIKVDHALAQELWASKNHDARILATMIDDAAAVDVKQAAAWAKELSNYVLTDALAKLVARSPVAKTCADKWVAADAEWVSAAGWTMVGCLAMQDPGLADAYFEDRVKAIESGMDSAKNRTRHAMNMALIGIGARNARLEKRVLAAAARIGPVEIDHGDTDCKTPDVAAYIQKIKARSQTATRAAPRPAKAARKPSSARK